MSEQESLSSWVSRVLAMAQESDGVHRALMPPSGGASEWSFDPATDCGRVNITLSPLEDDE